MVVVVAATQPLASNCSSTAQAATPVGSVSLPASTTQRMAQVVHYLEQNGFSPNAAAGATGNMMQESSLDPSNSGGLVANIGSLWQQQVAYDQQHGMDPTSAQGQLAFIVFFAKQQSWFAQFNGAKTPQDAALWWQDNYEQCSGAGARGTDQVGGGLCNPAHRQSFAVTAAHAGGGSSASSSFVSSTTTTGCATSAAGVAVNTKGQTNPAPGATWSRLDMGIDGNYNMQKGAVAAFSGTIHCCISGWPGQGVYFWLINDQKNVPIYERCMYYAEGATPIQANGAHVNAGQPVGRPVPSGGDGAPGNFEIGPCQTGNGDTLAKSSSNPRAIVIAFYSWLRKLGAGPASQTSHAGFA